MFYKVLPALSLRSDRSPAGRLCFAPPRNLAPERVRSLTQQRTKATAKAKRPPCGGRFVGLKVVNTCFSPGAHSLRCGPHLRAAQNERAHLFAVSSWPRVDLSTYSAHVVWRNVLAHPSSNQSHVSNSSHGNWALTKEARPRSRAAGHYHSLLC